MSVFQRGGSYLRGLTKLYSDTKQSYECASVASKNASDEDPDHQALRREFRIQKDRLLAWGLQWSDSNASSSPDVEIDQKLDQAGVGHVVASVMSEIQKLLVESEMIQNPKASIEDKSMGQSPLRPSTEKIGNVTGDEMAKPQFLLAQLTNRIDCLYKLSESRRTLSNSPLTEKPPEELIAEDNPIPIDVSGPQSQHTGVAIQSDDEQTRALETICEDKLFIDPSSIRLVVEGAAESELPPPYEEVMPVEKTRQLGRLVVSSLSKEQLSLCGGQDDDQKIVLVEYVPILHNHGAELAKHCQFVRFCTHRIFSKQRSLPISHNGVLLLLGYTIDVAHARHGYVFALPSQGPRQDLGVRVPHLSNLRAAIPPRREELDLSSPSLEDRFRLGFNILLAMLHLWVQGRRYGNLNGSNIVIVLLNTIDPKDLHTAGIASDDVRRPYLAHSSLPGGPLSPATESLSASIYRHGNDTYTDAMSRPWAFEIYSFGLILLEIGLWTPLSRLWKAKYTKSIFTSRIKSNFIHKLAPKCGTAYMKVVQSCINAPDMMVADSSHVPSKVEAKYWYSYMTRTGRLLAQCCAIDICGPACGPDLDYFERLNKAPLSFGFQSGIRLNPFEPSPYAAELPTDADSTCEVKASVKEKPSPSPSLSSRPRGRPATARKWNNVEIPQESLDHWNGYLMPKMSKLLKNALGESSESCSASIMMVGKTPETAKTTICIQCTSVDEVRDYLRKTFKCKNGWGLLILRGDVRRSGHTRRKGRGKGHRRGTSDALRRDGHGHRAYQQRPQLGASIGTYRDQQHLPPVSFGGAILVDNELYGMTVHHMLDAPSDDEDESDEDDVQRSSGKQPSNTWLPPKNWRSGYDDQSPPPTCDDYPPGSSDEALDLSEEESDGSTIRPEYMDFDMEDEDSGFWLDDGEDYDSDDSDEMDDEDEDDDDDDRMSVGDIVGIDPSGDEEIYVTQPAIRDVEDGVFAGIEHPDHEHLQRHSLGRVHASSGIRRVVTGAIKHEVDWALIKIREERLAVGNAINQPTSKSKGRRRATGKRSAGGGGPGRSAARDLQAAVTELTSIAPPSSLGRLAVCCHARTSGLQSGRISPGLALVKFYGRTSFSSSWMVEGGEIGVPGDSGAWIYDPHTGRVCGHVLAWGSRSQSAYMAPMDVLFEDIRRRLGAERVELPGGRGLELPSGVGVASTSGSGSRRKVGVDDEDGRRDGIRNMTIHLPSPPSSPSPYTTLVQRRGERMREVAETQGSPRPATYPRRRTATSPNPPSTSFASSPLPFASSSSSPSSPPSFSSVRSPSLSPSSSSHLSSPPTPSHHSAATLDTDGGSGSGSGRGRDLTASTTNATTTTTFAYHPHPTTSVVRQAQLTPQNRHHQQLPHTSVRLQQTRQRLQTQGLPT